MVQFKYEYLLPIGSIVRVKGIEQRLMVIGVLQKGTATGDRIFDYVSVPYPEGRHDVHASIAFDHKDVEEVVFRGYEDKDRKAFLFILDTMAYVQERKRKKAEEDQNHA